MTAAEKQVERIEDIERIVKDRFSRLDPQQRREWVRVHQGILYAMTGGGFLGTSFVEQPTFAYFAYVDDRAGKLRYTRREIETARIVLIIASREAGMDPEQLDFPSIHNCGAF